MKTVEKVSIGGYVFTMETGAEDAVAAYLDELKAFYSTKPSGEEIMEGIEERLAELLLEQAPGGSVVTAPMVAQVTATLGRPEAIEAEDAAPGSESTSGTEPSPEPAAPAPRRRLYRDTTSRIVAGVCSGLGTFFNIEPVIFRLAFVLLTVLGFWTAETAGVSAPLLYVILWICMPVARTVRQRDELRGRSGTVDGISQRIRQETLMEPVREGSPTLSRVVRFLGFLLGIALFLAGVAVLACIGALVWGNAALDHGFIYNKILEQFSVLGVDLSAIMADPVVPVLGVLSILLPAVGLIYAGIMFIFGLRSPRWHPGLVLFVVWLLVLVALAVFVAIALANGGFTLT